MSWSTFANPAATPEQVESYTGMLATLHEFHDALACAAPGADVLDALSADLRRWRDILGPMAVPENDRLSGRLSDLPMRGHAALPPFIPGRRDDRSSEGTVTFGSYFLGGGAAAHGGLIATVFDELLGGQCAAGGRGPARTAYLTTNFRALVPIDEPLRVVVWIEREEGRKRFMRGEMWHGETLCAEADALFIALRAEAA